MPSVWVLLLPATVARPLWARHRARWQRPARSSSLVPEPRLLRVLLPGHRRSRFTSRHTSPFSSFLKQPLRHVVSQPRFKFVVAANSASRQLLR